jgi:hypothetical protein
MTTQQKIAELKAQFPTLTYGVNDEIFTMTPEEYEATVTSWAETAIAKEQAAAEKAAAKEAAEAKLAALGLTADDLKALGL